MNLDQLERIRRMTQSIRAEIETDTTGSTWVSKVLTEFEVKVDEELKGFVWRRYKEKHR